MLYIIKTEDKGNVEAIASTYFNGFNAVYGLGYWKGNREESITLEIFTEDTAKVVHLAEDIKRINKQESVLVASVKSAYSFV